MGTLSDFAAGSMVIVFFFVQIGIVGFILVAIWRGVKALERVAESLQQIAGRGTDF